jgi:hypothetical protein
VIKCNSNYSSAPQPQSFISSSRRTLKALHARNQALSLPFQKYDVNHASGSRRCTREEQYANGSCGPPEALATFRDGLVGDLVDTRRTCEARNVEVVGRTMDRRADREEEATLLGVRKDMFNVMQVVGDSIQ